MGRAIDCSDVRIIQRGADYAISTGVDHGGGAAGLADDACSFQWLHGGNGGWESSVEPRSAAWGPGDEIRVEPIWSPEGCQTLLVCRRDSRSPGGREGNAGHPLFGFHAFPGWRPGVLPRRAPPVVRWVLCAEEACGNPCCTAWGLLPGHRWRLRAFLCPWRPLFLPGKRIYADGGVWRTETDCPG